MTIGSRSHSSGPTGPPDPPARNVRPPLGPPAPDRVKDIAEAHGWVAGPLPADAPEGSHCILRKRGKLPKYVPKDTSDKVMLAELLTMLEIPVQDWPPHAR